MDLGKRIGKSLLYKHEYNCDARPPIGALQKIQLLALKQLMLLCCVLYVTQADSSNGLLEASLVFPNTALLSATVFYLSPSSNPAFDKQRRNYFSHAMGPAHPPDYGPLVTSKHPPSSSGLSKPSMKKTSPVAPSVGLALPRLADIAPTGSGSNTMPASFSQPPLSPHASGCCGPDMVLKRETEGCQCAYPIKIDLLLLNVSSNPNWKRFLQEFASDLGVRDTQINLVDFYVVGATSYNISINITPHTGLSFSSSAASAINSTLVMHKVRLDPTLVSDYKLLNLTWFRPLAPSQAPVVATSPLQAPPRLPSSPIGPVTDIPRKHSNLHLIIGVGSGILILSIIAVLFICFYYSHRGKRRTSTKDTKEALMFKNEISEKQRTAEAAPATGSLRHPTSTRFLAYEELKEATNNFESASVIGEGGFGRVFKGVLSDGTAVAIKKLTTGGMQGDKEFLVEVEMLSRLHHRNLVKLVGYYTNRDSSQNLLCYELVPNGSLEAWLHGPLGVNCPLDWDTRMKIALDAARGLAYLHEDSQPCVIHRDFKASNILLENNFCAKVADFGLAKQAPEGRTNHLSTRVMGTFGYVAPEYAMTGHLLVKSDVYSYGVVLLELLTGRKPVDMSKPSGQENLVTWARPILRDKDRLDELGDSRLEGKYPKDDFTRVCTIAAACVAPEANQRPTMGEVVQSLKMVQRVTEYHDSMMASSNARPAIRQSSTTVESDGTSSMFSSGPLSGFSAYDNENLARPGVSSEDLHEGR